MDTYCTGSIIVKRRMVISLVALVLLAVALACSAPGSPAETPTAAEEAEVTAGTAPAAPTNLGASRPAAREILLTWVDNSADEEGFVVKRAPADDPPNVTELGRPAADAATFSDGSVECGESYVYLVSAFNAAGISAPACLQVTMPEACDDMSQPLAVLPCSVATAVPTATQFFTPVPGAPTFTPVPTPTTAPSPTPPVCGDDTCSDGENALSCADDCTECGDAACTGDETAASCPGDCPASCGDDTCSTGEDASVCPDDCTTCGDSICSGDESWISCDADCDPIIFPVFWCGDGICNGSETFATCSEDCPLIILPFCGDGICNGSETFVSCSQDCPPIILPPPGP